MLEVRGNVMTWEQFKKIFYKQFFFDLVCFEKK